MSEREPITAELREAVEWEPTFCGPDRAMVPQPEFADLCDAIDAVHAGLERENAELRERVAVLDNRSENMHEISSATVTITDELRKYVQSWRETPNLMDELDAGDIDGLLGDFIAIADRIDAEHERQLEVLYRDMSDAEYVKLTKDTGGEYIHEHDKVDWRDHAGTWHENATVVALCNDGCYVMDGTVFHVHKSDIRHHHEPTVEDVLREFADEMNQNLGMYTGEAIDADEWRDADNKTIAEYASKLRLAEGEDA